MPPYERTANNNTERLDALTAKKNAIDAQINRLRAEAATAERKRDTRRKILVGAIILEEAARNPKFANWLQLQLTRGLTQQRDRILFNLPASPSNGEQASGADANGVSLTDS